MAVGTETLARARERTFKSGSGNAFARKCFLGRPNDVPSFTSNEWCSNSGPIDALVLLLFFISIRAPPGRIKKAATEEKLTGPIEMSDLRETDHGPGRFVLCIRGVDLKYRRVGTYAVFFDNNDYTDRECRS